jgi:hypothetical protein
MAATALRGLNTHGVSQANEPATFASLNIAKTANNRPWPA